MTTVGCGGDPDDRPALEQRLETIQEAFDRPDLARVCDLMTQRARTLLVYMAHGQDLTCSKNLATVRKWMANGRRSVIGPAPDPVGFEFNNGGARAIVQRVGESPYAVRVAETQDGWKLDGLFDAGTSQKFQGHSGVPFDPAPTVDGVARNTAPLRAAGCPRVRTAGARGVGGGCIIEVSRASLRVSLMNLFGRMRFTRCDVRLKLHVDGAGRTWTNDFVAVGGQACGDIRACASDKRNSHHPPWEGQVERAPDGSLRLRFRNVCLDTCIGMYQGAWAMRLERTGDVWRLRSDKAMVGRTGWIFDGSMPAKGAYIRFAAR